MTIGLKTGIPPQREIHHPEVKRPTGLAWVNNALWIAEFDGKIWRLPFRLGMLAKAAKDIDEYIAGFPNPVRKMLSTIRATIRKAAPQAIETISYQMPTFKLNGNLIHFAAYKNHIGIYPAPRAIEKFKKQLARYEGSKGTIRLPLDEPVPVDLISDIVKFRVKMNLEKSNKTLR